MVRMATRAARQAQAKRRLAAFAAGVASLSALAAPCLAADDGSTPAMPIGELTAAPAGFLEFCARTPAECGLSQASSVEEWRSVLYRRYYWSLALPSAADRQAPSRPVASRRDGAVILASYSASAQGDGREAAPAPPDLMTLLKTVDRSINHAIRYVRAGADDAWDLPIEQAGGAQATGDCKDYVLEKRRALIRQGVAPQALSIALVQTWRGESHAVLLVATDKGEYALDNLSDDVKRWDRLGYRWVSRQAPGETFRWVSVGAAG